ncbi:MAG: nitrogenase cofactor biosynthesis protein NifB [Humidesulfovibrio sp.]|uniref:nitrogenase cofactor biosynthesis protein NifB n=1 Tax=Humidesulfovibrio sp. TaxID=2910988 RepID=UPI0027EF269C|nr:nitrogenase cofactor biosynthesis protein NifB [Humidesulfovibrio sp.]MDQ7835626.1 nitrogenase cofactor biosynthesis protein NifB [Humidesulfovibrio sp.]
MQTIITTPNTSASVDPKSVKHPCFNKESSGSCGRVHLPVAPKCNIQCNYCNRKYDCVNESRPGVTSGILKPFQALEYTRQVLDKEPRITVIGIAGPGDPMANPAETLETMRLIRKEYPHMLFCLSSNGLAMPEYLDDLADLGVTHATVTLNTIDPAIGAKIYSWVRDGNVVYRGQDAAELILGRQLEAIEGLKARGLAVKVNTIVIPGVNDTHIQAVAQKAQELGVDLQNLMPMHPTEGTPFGELVEPSKEQINALRAEAGPLVPQMTHCRRCRADAVGLLCHDRSTELGGVLSACSKMPPANKADRPYVAVATREGLLVNLHLGEAKRFQIWGLAENGGFRMVEERQAPTAGCGPSRWEDLAKLLSDCRAVLVAAVGDTPRRILAESGTPAAACSGFIEEALALAYGEDGIARLEALRARRGGVGKACCGTGDGC